ncbi:MAG: carbon-nitrogen hydrolase family protein [Granulosicoccus sp.]
MSEANVENHRPCADFRLAIGQHAPTPSAIDQSLKRMSSLANAAGDDIDLLVLPEASLTGYNIPLSSAELIAVGKNSNATDQIKSICQQANIAIAYGYIERDGSALYNSAHVIDSAGNSIAHYRKCHLWGELDKRLFTAGSCFSPVFELSGWQLALLICYDIEFPESARYLSLQGAELIVAPTALMHPWTLVADHMTRVRAAENQVYFAYANYCDREGDIEYVGRSCIVGPDGNDLARAESSPALIKATLNKSSLTEIRSQVPYHRDRRPELYS